MMMDRARDEFLAAAVSQQPAPRRPLSATLDRLHELIHGLAAPTASNLDADRTNFGEIESNIP